jgi:hypothetical protein
MPPPTAEFIDTAVGMTIGRLAIQIELRMGIFAGRVAPLFHPTRVYPSWTSIFVEVGYIRLQWERVPKPTGRANARPMTGSAEAGEG